MVNLELIKLIEEYGLAREKLGEHRRDVLNHGLSTINGTRHSNLLGKAESKATTLLQRITSAIRST